MAYDLGKYKIKHIIDDDELDCPELTRIAKRLVRELRVKPGDLTLTTMDTNLIGNPTVWGRIGEALMEAVWKCGGTPK